MISDVHANLAALEAVLAELDASRPDELWCLGDLVGYGAKPNECTRTIAGRASFCLAGNHDLAIIGTIDLADFSGDAGTAAAWTRDVLEDDARTFLDGLDAQGTRDGVELYHGSARDPVWEYVLSDESAIVTLALTQAPVVLVGHSHVALHVAVEDLSLVEGGLAAGGSTFNLGGRRCLLNPGSVGQPRDGDPRAAWLELDFDTQTATFKRTDYDIERTQREIRDAGLPEVLARRLSLGT